MTNTKAIIVGDIHGEAKRLLKATEYALNQANCRIIFVGDYIDRGPSSREALETLSALWRRRGDRVTFLRGNHEQALLDFLDGGATSDFVAHGGLATAASYLNHIRSGAMEEFRDSFPLGHREFLRSTQAYFEDDDMLVSHAGFDPLDPL